MVGYFGQQGLCKTKWARPLFLNSQDLISRGCWAKLRHPRLCKATLKPPLVVWIWDGEARFIFCHVHWLEYYGFLGWSGGLFWDCELGLMFVMGNIISLDVWVLVKLPSDEEDKGLYQNLIPPNDHSMFFAKNKIGCQAKILNHLEKWLKLCPILPVHISNFNFLDPFLVCLGLARNGKNKVRHVL